MYISVNLSSEAVWHALGSPVKADIHAAATPLFDGTSQFPFPREHSGKQRKTEPVVASRVYPVRSEGIPLADRQLRHTADDTAVHFILRVVQRQRQHDMNSNTTRKFFKGRDIPFKESHPFSIFKCRVYSMGTVDELAGTQRITQAAAGSPPLNPQHR